MFVCCCGVVWCFLWRCGVLLSLCGGAFAVVRQSFCGGAFVAVWLCFRCGVVVFVCLVAVFVRWYCCEEVLEKSCRKKLERRVGEECCREVL